MTEAWGLILGLAGASLAIRVAGLILGGRIARSRMAWVLDELPGLIVISLVATSLAGAGPAGWLAGLAALAASIVTRNVIVAMAAGMATFAVSGLYVFYGI